KEIKEGQDITNIEELDEFIKTNCLHLFKDYVLKPGRLFEFTLFDNIKTVQYDKLLAKSLGLEKEIKEGQDITNIEELDEFIKTNCLHLFKDYVLKPGRLFEFTLFDNI
ncbi:hypothetical protein, partial [Citrobacter portucalensis]|uniref:hypothetical protein n=1 Tax=Citrobacter portucalensis TaxID=1639133 RepID=UPI00301C4EFE